MLNGKSSLPEQIELPEPRVPTATDTLLNTYNTLLTAKIDSLGTVGAALVITHNGEIIFERCFGVKEAGGTDSIDIHTVFRLASVSKTVTGVLAGILSKDNSPGLDEYVSDYLPGLGFKDSITTADLKIRHLLSHTSGLVPHAYDNLVEAKVPYRVIMDSLYRVNISASPGELYGYQNVMFSLYDTISALANSSSFPDLLSERVFQPFGMSDASAGFAPFENNKNKAYPHRRGPKGFTVSRLNDRYYSTLPAAGINASIYDMGHFLIALSTLDSSGLSSDVKKEIFSPQVRTPLRWVYFRKWDRLDSKDYGIGWRIVGYKGRTIAYHGGYVQGYRAELAYCEEDDLGIAFLTNSPNGVGSISIPLFLDLYFGMKDQQDPQLNNSLFEDEDMNAY